MASAAFPLGVKSVIFDASNDALVVVPRPEIFYVIANLTATSGSSAKYGAAALAPNTIQGPIFMMPSWYRRRITCQFVGLASMSGSGYAGWSLTTINWTPPGAGVNANKWQSGLVVSTLTGAGQPGGVIDVSPYGFLFLSGGTISTGATPFAIGLKFGLG